MPQAKTISTTNTPLGSMLLRRRRLASPVQARAQAPPPVPAPAWSPTSVRNPKGKRKNPGFQPIDVENSWTIRVFCGFLDHQSNPMEPRLLTLLLLAEAHCRQWCHCLVEPEDLADRSGRSVPELLDDLAALEALGWIHTVPLGDSLGIVLLDRADHNHIYANTPDLLDEAVRRLEWLAGGQEGGEDDDD